MTNVFDLVTNKQKAIIVRYYFNGQKFPEIAKIMGITTAAARQRHYRAIKKLGFKPKKTWLSKHLSHHYCFTADVNSWNGVG